MRRKRKCQGQYFLFSMSMAKKCKSALLNLINMPFLDIVARQIRESGRGGMRPAIRQKKGKRVFFR
ncbi:hypothetical protein, partial [Aneurinibacillus migulanus]|uniref:hypothetical protein n=1 Tax=Aneurinibacillus migulanus TaxID=47500 RepID=UPI001C472F5F